MKALKFLVLFVVAFVVTACSMTRYVATPSDKITLKAEAEVNPDLEGRPSPISVKVYELSSRATFDALDFDKAWSNATVVLSDQLLSSAEFVLLPKQTKQHQIALRPNTTHIAIVAAYRDIDHAKWKRVYAVNSSWFYRHAVSLTANAVEVDGSSSEKDTD